MPLKPEPARIEPGVRLQVGELSMDPGSVIEEGAEIACRQLRLRRGARIERGVRIGGMRGGPAERIDLGEQSTLGHDVKVALPELVVGDYVSVHNRTLLNGEAALRIGHNCWIGQGCLLNSEAPLRLGNGVCVSANNSIYTHGYWGDQLQGCQLANVAPTTLEDDVWLMGSYTLVGPGITLGRRAVVLSGAVVTRSVEPGQVVGGTPARPVEWSEPLYVERTPEQQLEMMRDNVAEFLQSRGQFFTETATTITTTEACFWFEQPPSGAHRLESLGFVCLWPDPMPPEGSLFCLPDARYRRGRGAQEIDLLRFLRSRRARFVPLDRLVVD